MKIEITQEIVGKRFLAKSGYMSMYELEILEISPSGKNVKVLYLQSKSVSWKTVYEIELIEELPSLDSKITYGFGG